ncbi:hypothetical protein C2E20_5829 [Micractinium conductrix]|uniref:Uncharacterized protein n=1 Tax=Micractinium conductrix TaxID=554055 RepID=A0A2P6V9H1_9CHLO|nr:hypothetical protein C2E20_5829 [Micractinium conductrix]|eukprot:PSC70721.1 hypothetical protein C2E20_5829 [Micractinium conductrix]
MGFKPATHSTRTLVPLADVTAPTRVLAPPSAASKAAPACGATPEPAPSLISSTIGDPGLDDAEAELQAELAMADRRLETLQQQVQRRSATPEPGAAASVGAREVPWVAAPPQHARQHAAPQATPSAAPAPQQEQLGPPPAASPPPIPPSDMSIVRTVTTATGTGCKDVLAAHATVLLPPGACWTSRGHRVLHLESSCILQLYGRTTSEITLRITFAEAASVPRIVRLEHAPSTSAAFERLGDIKLQEKSLKQLRHLFRLGRTLEVQRFLRITLVGHMAEPHSGRKPCDLQRHWARPCVCCCIGACWRD